MIPSEHYEQVTFVNWVKKQSLTNPIYEMLFAIPNGGQRNRIIGAKLKLEGVKPGIPDLMFAVARKGYHGLFIEMKRQKGGNLQGNQKKWRDWLLEQGYAVTMAKGAEHAKRILLDYLN